MENINGDARDETDQNDINVKLPLELANLQVIEKTKEIDELQEKIKKVEEQSKKVFKMFLFVTYNKLILV